jgi:dTDP-4-dehydrorhamnose 3,5-epimerase
MQIVATPFPDVFIIEPKVFGDERGFFYESYNRDRLRELFGLDVEFVQDNHSRSSRNVVRGLHYQIRQPQGKLVRATLGQVYDVVVDLRRSSPMFGRWFGVTLSAENKRMLWVPPGYAHGFAVQSEVAEFLYKTTDYWAPPFERTLLWNDPELAIDWQLSGEPTLAPKDAAGRLLRDAEVYA